MAKIVSLTDAVAEFVHDGDTVALDPLGGLSVRFLGVDAPEVSFTLPGGAPDRFVSITDEASTAVLDGPLAASLPPFDPPLTAGLRGHLNDQTGTAKRPTTPSWPGAQHWPCGTRSPGT